MDVLLLTFVAGVGLVQAEVEAERENEAGGRLRIGGWWAEGLYLFRALGRAVVPGFVDSPIRTDTRHKHPVHISVWRLPHPCLE